jgi:hypothetical protein
LHPLLQISLPTGAKVYVLDGWVIQGMRFLNIKVLASTLDYNNTEGKLRRNQLNNDLIRNKTIHIR